MAAIDQSLISRELHELVKRRKNWAAREAGVVLVFCIVFVVASLLIGLFLWKKFQARRAAKADI
jgi:diacylglycerol kinase